MSFQVPLIIILVIIIVIIIVTVIIVIISIIMIVIIIIIIIIIAQVRHSGYAGLNSWNPPKRLTQARPPKALQPGDFPTSALFAQGVVGSQMRLFKGYYRESQWPTFRGYLVSIMG